MAQHPPFTTCSPGSNQHSLMCDMRVHNDLATYDGVIPHTPPAPWGRRDPRSQELAHLAEPEPRARVLAVGEVWQEPR
eukprot:SAG25_NODE_2589_length_1512_cov_1.364473_1_plen_77_part_01